MATEIRFQGFRGYREVEVPKEVESKEEAHYFVQLYRGQYDIEYDETYGYLTYQEAVELIAENLERRAEEWRDTKAEDYFGAGL